MAVNPAKIDPDLETTDRLCDIWSRDGNYLPADGQGMHPLEVMRLLNEGEVLGGKLSDDEVMIVLDQSIIRAPARYKSTITVWYRHRGPAEVKAKRLGVSRSALYVEWRVALTYLRATLRAKGLAV